MKALSVSYLLLTSIFFSCGSADENALIKESFDKEIQNRVAILNSLTLNDDSLGIEVGNVRMELDKLLLLSKDIENLSACAVRSDIFFQKMASDYEIDPGVFEHIRKEMSAHEIELVLKRNELFLLNHLIFVHSGGGIQLNSVKEEKFE